MTEDSTDDFWEQEAAKEADAEERELAAINGAVIYCRYRQFYWSATCRAGNINYDSVRRIHGSARQAADEILAQIRSTTGHSEITLRRIYPEQYQIVVPND